MLFDVHPKTSITELFGRRAEYLSFIEAVNELEKEYGIPYAVVDARAATSINSKYPQRVIAERLYKALVSKGFVGGVVSKIKGIKIGGIGIETDKHNVDIIDILSAIKRGTS